MAIKLVANYSKRLGLPGYSSHQFSVSIETELLTTDDVPGEARRIYHMLQTNVDEQIQATGFIPTADYGHQLPKQQAPRQNNQPQAQSEPDHDGWTCSEKQENFIRRIMKENNLVPKVIDDLAHQRFGRPAPRLNKMQASGLIDALLDQYGTKGKGNQR
ncbi:hypothetical protein OAF99_02825 [Akkermansiaceae bacterium]|nr:hypothetical protein [Akkermansiaceae bacterium]